MTTYLCLKCKVNVTDRAKHSETATHTTNGGSATVVESDYRIVPGDTPNPMGTSKVRG